MEYNFKKLWKETLLSAATLLIFIWGIFDHFVAALLGFIVVLLAFRKLGQAMKLF